MAQIPDSSAKSVSQGDVTAADIEEFRRSREAQEFVVPVPDMSGDQYTHMDSSRYDAQSRGYAAEPAYTPQTEPTAPLTQDQPAYPEPEQPNYQQKYGEALNQMGEWRRAAQDSQSQLQQLMAEMTDIKNRLTSPQPNYQQPQPNYYQQPPPTPQRLFLDKQPGELMTVGEFEEYLQRDILPSIAERTQASMFMARDMAAAEAQRMLPSWDVQPSEESMALAQLRQQFANFDMRFTAIEKNNMIRNQVAITRQTSGIGQSRPPQAIPVGRVTGNGAPVPPQRPIVVDPSRALRKDTYVESSAPAQIASEPTSTMTPNQQFKADLARLDAAARAQGKSRASAADVKVLLQKYGVSEVNDWPGGDGVAAR